MFAELFGRATGYCAGRGGSMHIADVTAGNLGGQRHCWRRHFVGSGRGSGDLHSWRGSGDRGIPVGWGFQQRSLLRIHESGGDLNLPLILVIENNQYAVSTPIEQSTREPELYKRGPALRSHEFDRDGNHVLEVYERACEAVSQCRAGKGPGLDGSQDLSARGAPRQ